MNGIYTELKFSPPTNSFVSPQVRNTANPPRCKLSGPSSRAVAGLGDINSDLQSLFGTGVSVNPALLIAGVGLLFLVMSLTEEPRVKRRQAKRKAKAESKIQGLEDEIRRVKAQAAA